MKLAGFIGLFVVLSCAFAIAGESYDLYFSEGSTQGFYLYEGDEVRFELNGDEHVIILDTVQEASVSFWIIPYTSNNSKMGTGWVSLDTVANIDLEKDGPADIRVALYGVDGDGMATIIVQQISGEVSDQGDVGVVGEEDESIPGWKSTVLKVIAVVAIILIVFFIFKGKGEEKVVESEVLEKTEEKILE